MIGSFKYGRFSYISCWCVPRSVERSGGRSDGRTVGRSVGRSNHRTVGRTCGRSGARLYILAIVLTGVPGVPQTTPRLPHGFPEASQRPPEHKSIKSHIRLRREIDFWSKYAWNSGPLVLFGDTVHLRTYSSSLRKKRQKVSKSQDPIRVYFRTRNDRALCGKWHSGERSCARYTHIENADFAPE